MKLQEAMDNEKNESLYILSISLEDVLIFAEHATEEEKEKYNLLQKVNTMSSKIERMLMIVEIQERAMLTQTIVDKLCEGLHIPQSNASTKI